VQSKYFVDDRVKGRRIDVDTRSGIVTLSGEVADENERAQALLLARTTEGVARVEDHLTVVPYGTQSPPAAQADGPVNDAMITTTIQAKYFVDPQVKASAVDVSSKNSVVVLQGTVASEAARKQALAIAQNSQGVVQVIDRLTVAQPKR
jgi:osmotically-inducible protein OsmY